MKWLKKGLVYCPDGTRSWAKKYAFPPTPYLITDRTIRLYVAFCDDQTVGRVGFVDVDAENPAAVLRVSEEPVLDIGRPGAFDENGVVPTSVLEVDGKLYLYYVGYQLGAKVRYYQFQGLAISEGPNDIFTRYSKVPILDRSDSELLNRASGFVMCDQGIFKMWYSAGSEWVSVRGRMLPKYNIRYLESRDGIQWQREGRVCLDFNDPDEHALGRPYVIKDADTYRMFYSVRTMSKGYRLGYAESSDGLSWVRKDQEVGIDVSQSGWDSESVEYPSVVRFKDSTYLFHNGNNCGETGFGYAVLKES